MLRIWTDRESAGVLDRRGRRGTTFAYDPEAAPQRAVSVTMPVRTASWRVAYGLLPIFDMNVPEGALRVHLNRRFAKAPRWIDEFDLLNVVGRSQIGRIRYSDLDAELSEDVPLQSVDEILRGRRGGELFDHLMNTFAVHSGLSGVQPKVMIRATEDQLPEPADRRSQSFRGATHIVKFWEAEFPELAANEYFGLSAAKALHLPVADFALSDDGLALVVKRFDLKSDGASLGYEDFCVLNGLTSAEKYLGGYETRLFRRAREFIDFDRHRSAFEDLFKLFALNCAIRNGDAHLKNFGILYDDVTGPARLAPAYDLVSTVPYLPKDRMALTLNGSTNWPDRKALTVLGQTRCDLALPAIAAVFEGTADALATIAPEIERYFKERAAHRDVGARLLAAWQEGISDSLGLVRSRVTSAAETGPDRVNVPRFAPANRRRLSAPALRSFLAVADLWSLNERERLLVLGMPSRSTYRHWAKLAREHGEFTLDVDVLTRISAVLGIHQALGILYATEREGIRWLRGPHDATVFGGRPPLALVTSGTQDGLLTVRRFLDAARGGLYMAPNAADAEPITRATQNEIP